MGYNSQYGASGTAGYEIPVDLLEIIPGYVGRRNQDILDMKALLQAKNFEAIGRLAHKLKGNGASFGFDKLSEIGYNLQQATGDADFTRTQNLINDFENEVANIKLELRL